MPLVSVVIPTYERPDLIGAAVASALSQTMSDLEVVVVVDGGSEETIRLLSEVTDSRLRVVVPEARLGNAGARNEGVKRAEGEWIAFLDDDDEWLPGKLAVQLETADAASVREPIVSCRLVARNERASFVWPRRLPSEGERMDDYLFCRRTPGTGEGLAQTSTLLVRREFLLKVPFDDDLRRYVDLDWMLRAGAAGGTLVFPKTREPLSVWAIDEGRRRVTTSAAWTWDRDWARARRHLLSDRAYAAFLLTLASLTAAREGAREAFWPLLKEALREGRPSPAELAFHVTNSSLPAGAKAWLTARRFKRA